VVKRNKPYANYNEYLLEELQNPEFALEYLNETLKDEHPGVFLLAMKHVLEAQGGDMSSVAKQAELNRQNLYRILSDKGNPRWDSLTALFDALNLQVTLSFKDMSVKKGAPASRAKKKPVAPAVPNSIDIPSMKRVRLQR